MAIILYEPIGDDKGRVNTIIYDESLFDPEGVSEYVRVDKIPVAEENGKEAICYINIGTGEVFYDYRDLPPSMNEQFEERIAAAEATNKELQQAIADLTMTLAAVMAG